MLYKFKSHDAADVIMLEAHAQRVLEIIGKTGGPAGGASTQGILLAQDMPAAMAALEAAVLQEEAQRKAATQAALAKGEVPPTFGEVSLRQRTQPFLDILRRSHKAGHEVVWGV